MDPRESAALHRRRAQAALDIGRYSQAEREAREALSYGPTDDEALVLLSRALLGVGAYERALDAAHRRVVVAEVARMARESGEQLLVVSHQPGVLESLPARIVVRGDGRGESTAEVIE